MLFFLFMIDSYGHEVQVLGLTWVATGSDWDFGGRLGAEAPARLEERGAVYQLYW